MVEVHFLGSSLEIVLGNLATKLVALPHPIVADNFYVTVVLCKGFVFVLVELVIEHQHNSYLKLVFDKLIYRK